MSEYDEFNARNLDRIATSLQALTFWVGIAVALSIIGGIIYGFAYAKQQDRLEKILNGDTPSETCNSNPYSSLRTC